MTDGAPNLGLSVFSADLAQYPFEERRRLLTLAAEAGLNHLHCGDHVSFHGGYGWDGLINATMLLNLQDALPVHVGIYQLPLRHPTTVTRQLSTLCEPHPGRLVLGVGVGGDDRAEMEVCGVDPRTRGQRMDESLQIIRRQMTGEAVTFAGEIFDISGAAVHPAVDPPVPLIIGGRTDAAMRRTARLGDGWLAIWASPERVRAFIGQVEEEADRIGRTGVAWRHGIVVWCEFGEDLEQAERRLADNMQHVYKLPRAAFEKWSPAGTPEAIAEFCAPYLETGITDLTLITQGEDLARAIEAAAEVKRLVGLPTPA
jgi:alkanesulfonate monooxygenase SsuD/methylene tetrahydromethanopterin reductase-like flavin-dependent oxidoreductase (luciferase family)